MNHCTLERGGKNQRYSRPGRTFLGTHTIIILNVSKDSHAPSGFSWHVTPHSIAFWAPDLDKSVTFSPQDAKANTGPELCLLNYIFLRDALWNSLQMFSLLACRGRKFTLTHNCCFQWVIICLLCPSASLCLEQWGVYRKLCMHLTSLSGHNRGDCLAGPLREGSPSKRNMSRLRCWQDGLTSAFRWWNSSLVI